MLHRAPSYAAPIGFANSIAVSIVRRKRKVLDTHSSPSHPDTPSSRKLAEHDAGALVRAEKNRLREGTERRPDDNLCRIARRRAEVGTNRHGESIFEGML